MKKHLKLLSLLSLFVIAATTFFIFAKRPGEDKPETIMVRVQRFGLMDKSPVSIFYGENKIETSEFDPKALNKSVIGIIQRLNSEGYKVISHSESTGNFMQETWILTLK